MTNNKEAKLNTISAIFGLVILEGIALYKGLDGVMFSSIIIAISGLGGYHINKLFNKK